MRKTVIKVVVGLPKIRHQHHPLMVVGLLVNSGRSIPIIWVSTKSIIWSMRMSTLFNRYVCSYTIYLYMMKNEIWEVEQFSHCYLRWAQPVHLLFYLLASGKLDSASVMLKQFKNSSFNPCLYYACYVHAK